MKTSKALQLFLLDKQANGLAEKSVNDYKVVITKYLSEMKLEEVEDCTKEVLREWVVKKQEDEMKPVTINTYLTNIRVFLYWCMNEYDLKQYKIKLLKRQEEPLKLYTDEELQRLTEKPCKDKFTEWRTYTMICFALATGARISTICDVKVEDIDFELRSITYQHTKNKHTATVYFSPILSKIIQQYMLMFNINSGYLFTTVYGEQMNRDSSLEALIDYNTARGVERHSWHSFRHNYARTWLTQGGDLFKLQAMLQHQTLTQTQHYAKVFAEDLKDVSEYTALDTIIKRQKIKIH